MHRLALPLTTYQGLHNDKRSLFYGGKRGPCNARRPVKRDGTRLNYPSQFEIDAATAILTSSYGSEVPSLTTLCSLSNVPDRQLGIGHEDVYPTVSTSNTLCLQKNQC